IILHLCILPLAISAHLTVVNRCTTSINVLITTFSSGKGDRNLRGVLPGHTLVTDMNGRPGIEITTFFGVTLARMRMETPTDLRFHGADPNFLGQTILVAGKTGESDLQNALITFHAGTKGSVGNDRLTTPFDCSGPKIVRGGYETCWLNYLFSESDFGGRIVVSMCQ
ncbi:hypothetical protein PMAYCL1PPCAC_10642, partial [Pristionchus mayeri]